MSDITYYVDKINGTSADALLAIGFASLLGDLYARQYGTTEGIRISDAGPCYTVMLARLLDLDHLPGGPITLLLPLESSRQREKQAAKGRMSVDGFDYDGEMTKRSSYIECLKKLGPALQTPEARLRKAPELEELEDLAYDERLTHYAALNGMGVADSFNELALRWRDLALLQQMAHVRLLLKLFRAPGSMELLIPAGRGLQVWRELARQEGIAGEVTATALQIVNPSAGKGANRAKANVLSIGGQDSFWLFEALKFRGFMEAAAPLTIKENSDRQVKESKDRKTYVMLPKAVELDFLRDIMREFRAVFWPTTALKLDILASLRFAQVVVAYYKRWFQSHSPSKRPSWQKKRVTSLVEGFEVTFYKYLGSAYTVMHNAQLGLPTWLPELTTLQAVEAAESLLKEHVQLIQGLRNAKGEEGAEEYELLRLYRDFLSGHDLAAFWQFTAAYSGYYISAREHPLTTREQNRRYVVQLTTHGLEQLIMDTPQGTPPLAPIIENEGFQSVASAIREATVRAQYRRTQQNDRTYETRYGLGQDLMRQARHRDAFVQALCTFLHDYNAETAREEEKVATRLKRQLQNSDRREHRLRYMVSTSDIQAVISLIDSYGVELIGSMLIAFGYAFDSERRSTSKDAPSGTAEQSTQSVEQQA